MISVIVPVYNVAPYIAECIASIEKQTYEDWELILVDDGSTDDSGILCDQYAKEDARVRVIHLANGGVSRARNEGMSHARGEWVTFIDGDDWVEEDFLLKLFEPVLQNPELDFVHGGCLNYQEGVGVTVNQRYEPYQGSDHRYLLGHFRGLAVSKLFKKSILDEHQIQFDCQVAIAEDYLFTLDYLLYVRQYSLIASTGYYYRRRPTSATQSNQRISYESGIRQIEHNIVSLREYLAAYAIADAEAASRWKDIADNLFFLVRSNGWLSIGKGMRARISSLLRSYPIVEFQQILKRKVYLSAFRLYCLL